MVTEWFANAMSSVLQWLVAGIPLPPPPDWFGDAASFFTMVGTYMAWFQPWAPVSLVLAIMGLWVITFTLSIGLKLARMVLSFVTFGGGAT